MVYRITETGQPIICRSTYASIGLIISHVRAKIMLVAELRCHVFSHWLHNHRNGWRRSHYLYRGRNPECRLIHCVEACYSSKQCLLQCPNHLADNCNINVYQCRLVPVHQSQAASHDAAHVQAMINRYNYCLAHTVCIPQRHPAAYRVLMAIGEFDEQNTLNMVINSICTLLTHIFKMLTMRPWNS